MEDEPAFKVYFSQCHLPFVIVGIVMQEDRENIMRARATGKAVLTRPFRLLGSHHLGVVLTFPVYKSKLSTSPTKQERIEATAG